MNNYQSEELKTYCLELRKFVLLVGKNSEVAKRESEAHLLSAQYVLDTYSLPFGVDLYDFGLSRPSDRILALYEKEDLANYDDSLSIEERLLADISSSTVQLVVMEDGSLLLMRNRRSIYRGSSYSDQEMLDEGIDDARRTAVINWDEARIFFHVWKDIFYISDQFEPGLCGECEDEYIYILSVPLLEKMDAKILKNTATETLAELLSNGYRPRFFSKGSYLMNRLEVGDVFSYNDFDSFAGYFFPYVEMLSKTVYLDIEKSEKTYKISRIDKQAYAKPKRSQSQIRHNEAVEYVSQRAKQNLCQMDFPKSFIGIDFETLYSQRVSACSVGMVKYKEGKIVDRYYSLIKPPSDYPGKCGVALTWIHGFTEKMLENERTFAEVLPEMEAFAEGLPLVAHNACVERACIEETSDFYHLKTSFDCENIIDTYPLSRRVELALGICEEGRGTHSLDAVCRRFGVPEMSHHNALDDAEMCGNLLLAFTAALDGVQPMSLDESVTCKRETEGKKKILTEDKIQRSDLENIEDNPFKNKNVVLTGFDRAKSQDYAHKLQMLGAIVRDQVSGKTKILITGPNAGPSKIQKCKALGAEIISEEIFLEIISK